MSPKTRSVKARSCKKSVLPKTKQIAPKKPMPKAKSGTLRKTPKNKNETKSVLPETKEIALKMSMPKKAKTNSGTLRMTPKNKKENESVLPETKEIALKKSMPKKAKTNSGTLRKTPKNKKESESVLPETKEIAPKKAMPKKPKTNFGPLYFMKTPKNKRETESVLPETPADNNGNSTKKNITVSKKTMNSFLNGYKHSPDFLNLKKKRFNTGFTYEKKRRDPYIEIFPPEDDSRKWVDWPPVKNKIQGEPPGETYYTDELFKSVLIDTSSDDDLEELIEEIKKERKEKRKKGRKKSVGYKGIPHL